MLTGYVTHLHSEVLDFRQALKPISWAVSTRSPSFSSYAEPFLTAWQSCISEVEHLSLFSLINWALFCCMMALFSWASPYCKKFLESRWEISNQLNMQGVKRCCCSLKTFAEYHLFICWGFLLNDLRLSLVSLKVRDIHFIIYWLATINTVCLTWGHNDFAVLSSLHVGCPNSCKIWIKWLQCQGKAAEVYKALKLFL